MKKFDKTMMETAKLWSQESYCKKNKVGTVISIDGHVISHGYNGTISGHENICEEYEDKLYCSRCGCNDENKLKLGIDSEGLFNNICEKCWYMNVVNRERVFKDKTNQFTLHSEANAILWAAKEGYKTAGATIYVTTSPCVNCSKLIAQAGIKRVVYLEEYRKTEGLDFLRKCDILVEQYKDQ